MADTLDVIALATAKTALNLTITTHDTELARQITAVSRIFDDVVGPVVVRTVTDEEHEGARSYIQLRHAPVKSVTTVDEAQHGAVTTLSAVAFGETGAGYRAITLERNPTLLSGELRRRWYGAPCLWGPVQVTYEAGRFTDTASVDARFAEAACSVLRRLWKREAGTWAQAPAIFEAADATPGSGFYKAVKPIVEELLWDEMRNHLAGFA